MIKFIPLLLLCPLFVPGQQKEQILEAIIKINRLETADKGPFFPIDSSSLSAEDKKALFGIPSNYNNYENFQALRKLINHDELVALTGHQNGVVRLFAVRQLKEEKDYNFDFFNFFLGELNRNDTIANQVADMIGRDITYRIFLGELSGSWNYAHSTRSINELNFLNFILRPIDRFTLFSNFDFPDNEYEAIFDRQKFGKYTNARILDLIKTKYNFWAFNYLMKYELQLYDSIKTQTVRDFYKHKKELLSEHPDFFKGFLRYLITSDQYEMAKSFLQELKDRNYSEESIKWMLMGIDEELIKKIK